jgi:1-phosphofructokinase
VRRAQSRRRPAANPQPPVLQQRVAGRVAVLAPSPLLTVTIEPGTDRLEVHLHAGGQGFWVARLAATLGVEVVSCCALSGEPGRILSGEPGRILRGLIESDRLTLRAANAGTPNGVYVHDRRSGGRVEIVSVDSRQLDRRAADELYGIALSVGIDADVTLVTRCRPDDVIDPDLCRRLCGHPRANGKVVIADLTGPPLRATVEGGVEWLRLSEEELVCDHHAASDAPADIVAGARRLHAATARHVLVSRGSAPPYSSTMT